MPLRKTTAAGMALVSMGGTVRLPRVKLPPIPVAPPIPTPEPEQEPLPVTPDAEQAASERIIVVGRPDCPQVLAAMKELVDAGVSFSYCDAEQVPGFLSQLTRLTGPAGLPVVLTVRVAPEAGCAT